MITLKDKIDAQQNQIINRLNSLLEIKYVYESRVETEGIFKPLLIVILQGNCSSLTHELSAMVAKIFQEETDFLYRIFSFEYAQQQLKEENLFFVHGCTCDKLVCQNPDTELDSFYEYHVTEKILRNIQSIFEKEHTKITAFLEGATFFIEKNNLSHAAYMLHQYIELWFRFVALFTMGKERKSHSIKELQTYIKPFVPALGKLFNTETEEERSLLRILDDAYVSTRYENNYHINKEQILQIQTKANALHNNVTSLFKAKFNITREIAKTAKVHPNMTITPAMDSANNEKKIVEKIKKYAGEHFYLLKLNPHRKETYNIHIETKGYLDASFLLANFLKVSIMALESMEDQGESIIDADYAVQQVLKCALKLIPYEEMEFIDKIRNLLSESENKSQ